MQLIEMKTAAEAPKKGQTLYSYLIQFKAKKKFYLTISMKRNNNRGVNQSNIFSEIIMCLSKKSKIALILIMITASACFAQKWKGIVKGIESRTGGNNNSQAIEKNEPKETNNAKKNTAKLSNNPQVQKKAAYLTKAEVALNSKDYNTAAENYNKAAKTKLPSNVDKSDADILNTWTKEIYARLQYQNIKSLKNR